MTWANTSGELRTYLDGHGHVIRGNIEWSLRVPGYGRQENVRWAGPPTDESTDPVPVLAISWWWQQLT